MHSNDKRLVWNTGQRLFQILQRTLRLPKDWREKNGRTPLLDSVAELDSMTAMQILTELEDTFGFVIFDDEISGDLFETYESLLGFVVDKLSIESRQG